jgi:hypothetical protein
VYLVDVINGKHFDIKLREIVDLKIIDLVYTRPETYSSVSLRSVTTLKSAVLVFFAAET